MKRLFLMCGLSFSGKSVLARAMGSHLRAETSALDEIDRERGLPFGGEGIPVEAWEETHEIALRRLGERMPAGRDLIVDDTNCYRWLRDRFRTVAFRYGYRTTVVYLDLPLDTISTRMAENERTEERAGMKDAVFERLRTTFEPPEEDEETLIFREVDDVEHWLRDRFGPPGPD